MATSFELERKRSEVEARRREAEQAERQRREAETAHQRAIQTAERELAALEEQARQARLEEAKAVSDRLIADVNQQTSNLITAARNAYPYLAQLLPLWQQAEAAHERQQANITTAAEQYAVEARAIIPTPAPNEPAYLADERATQAIRADLFGVYGQFRNATIPLHALIALIAQASSQEEQRFWQAICFMRTGQLYNPDGEFNAQAATDTAIQQQRRAWRP